MADTAASTTALRGFRASAMSFNGSTKTVWVGGRGQAVIVMPEMPGISPEVVRFARWICDAGFTVFIPSLFGLDGETPTAEEGARIFQRACVSKEFSALAGQGASPVTNWLRALARHAHGQCGGPGVGAVGMCFTGNFALSMMLEPSVLVPVLSQPSLPLDAPEQIESDEDELERVRNRLERDGLNVLAFRFEGDKFCQAQRFARYQQALGDRFVGRTLPDKCAKQEDLPPFFETHVTTPHSVLTAHLVDREGELTLEARDEVIRHLKLRLLCME